MVVLLYASVSWCGVAVTLTIARCECCSPGKSQTPLGVAIGMPETVIDADSLEIIGRVSDTPFGVHLGFVSR